MKVLHIIDSEGFYGAEVMLVNLIKEQGKHGVEAVIASIGDKRSKEKTLEVEAHKRGIRVEKFRMRPGPNFMGAIKIIQYARSKQFDILHSHGYKGNILFGFMPKFIRRLPLISTLHGWTHTGGFSRMTIYTWLDSQSFKFMDFRVLVNKGMLSNPKLKGSKKLRFHVINNGIPIAGLQTQKSESTLPNTHGAASTDLKGRKTPTFFHEGIIIGSIGRLSAEKGYPDLIEAISLLRKEGLDARLIVIGEGGQRQHLQETATKCGVSKYVLLPGYFRNARKFISRFDVFAISSLTEGLPITLLEAMQEKTPIVATHVGGIPEVLDNGKAGVLVEPGNPLLLAQAIEMILNNKEQTLKLSEYAYHRVSTKYSSEKMAFEYMKLYEQAHRSDALNET
jgi:glycosyltransferase involved in cell wall biosynthesis